MKITLKFQYIYVAGERLHAWVAHLSLNRLLVDILCDLIQFDCKSAVTVCYNSVQKAAYIIPHPKM